MLLLTLEDFKGYQIDPNWSAFQVLVDVAEVGLQKLDEEEGREEEDRRNSSIDKKSEVVRKIKFVVRGKGASKETKANPVGEIAEQELFLEKPNEVGFERMNSAIEGIARKSSIKKRNKPNIPLVTESQTDMEERFSNEECVPVSEKSPNKQKKKNFKLNSILAQGPDSPSDLPEEFKNKISEMGGSEITLLIQKALFKTDTTKQHNRLLMPFKKIKKLDFLQEHEFRLLQQKQAMKVPLVQPSLELIDIVLGKWDMRKDNGTISSSYILRESWTKVINANNLKEDDVIQVWSFRVEDKLCIALVKLM